jgi:hypothetical protein
VILVPFNDYEIETMDRYLWLDYCIETAWLYYYEHFYGKINLSVEADKEIMKIMETIYEFETQIIDLLDNSYIDFFMIDQYKEEYNVRDWPARIC